MSSFTKFRAAFFAAQILLSGSLARAEDFFFEAATRPQSNDEIMLETGRSEAKGREDWFRMNGDLQVRNVAFATLTPVTPPRHLATGEAVIVAPGGGFLGLAIQNEGYDVADALAARGITAFVLKYRVLPTPADRNVFAREMNEGRNGRPSSIRPPADTPDAALADGQAAVRYVRANAHRWGVDPNRIGMMGFSAGAFLTLSTSVSPDSASRPDFAAAIYPRMTAVEPPPDAPPLFVAIASDDFLIKDNDFGLIRSWRAKGRPVEFHLYQGGGHGYGLGKRGTTTENWINDFVRWIEFNRAALSAED